MKKKIKPKVLHKKTLGLKKSLGALMKDEDGFVSKQTILKVGLSSVAALGITGALMDNTTGQTHTNSFSPATPTSNCATHTNITTHTSY